MLRDDIERAIPWTDNRKTEKSGCESVYVETEVGQQLAADLRQQQQGSSDAEPVQAQQSEQSV